MTSFVLLHGAFHGGWCWARVAPVLRAAGHDVFTPTQTGLGERAHLLSRDITLDTFVQDLVAVLETEELDDVVLVGHSFGGNAITGAAERVPGRIRSLIYLDGLIPQSGRTPLDCVPPEVAAHRRSLAAETGGLSVPPPEPGFFGVPPGPEADWVQRRMTPHPFGAYESALTYKGRRATASLAPMCSAPRRSMSRLPPAVITPGRSRTGVGVSSRPVMTRWSRTPRPPPRC